MALPVQAIVELAERLRKTETVYICGNGGSDSNAGHAVLHLQEVGINAVDLMADGPILTALSNDRSYETALRERLRRRATNRDALLVISGSGDSANILLALAEAGRIKMQRYGLLGFEGGAALPMCDLAVLIPSQNYGQIEDLHSATIHILAELLRC